MNKVHIILFFLVPLMSFNGCEDDELDKPANIRLEVSMEEIEDPGEKYLKQGKPMQINGGKIAIESIDFYGSRENAKDYNFSRSFENRLIGDLKQGELNKDVTFDIPQGAYNLARITLHLNAIDSLSGLMLHGSYNSPVFEKTKLEFAFFDNHEPIEIRIQNANGNNNKVLFEKGKTKTLEIRLNTNQLLGKDIFNPKRLEEANITYEGGVRKIIVSPEQNPEMYYSIVSRIDKSIKALLK